tara:strand:- start:242 stop:475 length:234 start_codon:yes stop_codon:yes gene_type:complete
LNPLLALGTTNIPKKNVMLAINKEEKKYGLRNLENDTPELNIEIISVLFANFDVNQITDKNNRIGKSKFPKYHIKSK